MSHVMAIMIEKAQSFPLGGVLHGGSLRGCSGYNAYMWAVREIADAVDQARAELTRQPPTPGGIHKETT